MKKEISILLKNLCCSKCKSDFDETSVEFIYQENNYNVITLKCNNCGKDFGTAFLKLSDTISDMENDVALKDNRDTPPISADEVLDAHEQIKDFEKNWKNFIED